MKRTTAFLLAFAFALPAAASESFVLNIPLRFNAQQETGEVGIVLGLDAAPAGSQLVVNGTTTLNLGDTAAVGTDSVTFAAGTGNAVRIVYKPLSNFGADFCDGAGATEKNVPMRFVGAQDITEYRLSSYVVGAPAAECSKVSKRSADAPANIVPTADGVAPQLDAIFQGRLPIDVVLVLDKSGSMSQLPPGAVSGATKAAILQSAIQAFVAQWREIDQGTQWTEDRIGVVFFDSTPAPQSLTGADPPANFFVQRGPDAPGPTHKWNAVSSNITTLVPGGSTSIGGGINAGMAQWVADPAHDLFLVVVTDGIQNTAPLITAVGGFLGLLPVGGLDQELRKRFIPIQTIGFGEPQGVDAELLSHISLETAGVSFITVNANDFFDVFGMTLVSILKGNTASLALRRQDSMTGAGPSAPQSVIVDASAQRAVFSVQWSPPVREALELEVFRPDGTLAVPSSAEKAPQAALQSFDLRPKKDLGTWTVRVKRNAATKLDPNRPVPYNLHVFFRERNLDYRLSFDTVHARTGDKIRLRAMVSYDGRPLTNLPADAIRARVLRPNEGLGTILHDTKVTDTGSSTSPGGDVLTPYNRKLARLGKRVLDRTVPKELATIALRDDKKGVYSVTFDQTSIPGTYAFEIRLDWDDPRTGRVRREERIEQIVRVKPDPAKTEITTTRTGTTVRINVTPRDTFGNYLGPCYESLVKAKLNSDGKLADRAPVDRTLTGTYVITVTDVPTGKTPDVDISVDGVGVGNPARKN